MRQYIRGRFLLFVGWWLAVEIYFGEIEILHTVAKWSGSSSKLPKTIVLRSPGRPGGMAPGRTARGYLIGSHTPGHRVVIGHMLAWNSVRASPALFLKSQPSPVSVISCLDHKSTFPPRSRHISTAAVREVIQIYLFYLGIAREVILLVYPAKYDTTTM